MTTRAHPKIGRVVVRVSLGVAALALASIPLSAEAFTTLAGVGPWPGGNVNLKFNVTSFNSTNLPGTNMTSTDAQRVIASAMNVWKERAGGLLNFTYGGNTTTIPNTCTSTTPTTDGSNEVAAVSGCLPGESLPNCFTWAVTQPFVTTGTTNIVEDDVCVFGSANSRNWSVRAVGMAANAKDVVGTLSHEFGHVLGLGHTAHTVMDSPTFNNGNTLSRYPYGDDVDGIRSLYGTVNHGYYFRTMAPTSTTAWSAETPGFTTQMNANSSIGWDSADGAREVMVADIDGGTIFFDRFSTAPAFLGSFSIGGFTSMRAPGVAGSCCGTWIGAWTNKRQTNDTCSDIVIGFSQDAFATVGTVDLTTDCTIHDPSVAYDEDTDLFILTYVRRSSTAGLDNQIVYRTAPRSSPSSWSALHETGITTVDAPTMACQAESQNCLLTWNRETSNFPQFVTQAATINFDGTLSLGGTTASADAYWKSVPGAVRVSSAGGLQWMIVDNRTVDNVTNELNGTYGMFSAIKNSTPISFGSSDWKNTNATAFHRPSLAAFSEDFDSKFVLVYER